MRQQRPAFADSLSGYRGATLKAETTPASASAATNAPSKFRSADDGWLDVSEFLAQRYGFLPVVIPITEPAVGYGAAGGLMFLSKPLPKAEDDLGDPTSVSLAAWAR